MRTRTGIGAAALCAALLTTSAGASEDVAVSTDVALEMSRTLTLEPVGSAPRMPVFEDATPAPPQAGTASRATAYWLVLLALLPVAFWLGRRRRPAAATVAPPAADPAQLDTLKARNAALDADLRRAHAGDTAPWQSTVTSLRNDLARARRRLDEQRDTAVAERHARQEAQERVHSLEQTLAQVEKHDAEQTHAIGQLDGQLQGIVAELETSQAEAAELGSRASEAQSLAQTQRQQIEELSAQLIDANLALEQTAAQMLETQERGAQHESAICERDDALAALRDELKHSDNRVQERSAQIADLETRISASTRAADDAGAERDRLRGDNARLEERLAEREAQCTRLEKELTGANAARDEAAEEIRKAEILAGDYEGKIRERDEGIAKARGDLADSQAQRERLTAELADAGAAREQAAEQVRAAEELAATHQSDIRERDEELARLRDELAQSEAREAERAGQIETLDAKLAANTVSADETDKAHELLRDANARLEETLAESRTQCERLEAELDGARAELAAERDDSAARLKTAEEKAALTDAAAREAREEWLQDRTRARELEEESRKAVSIAEAAARDLTRGLAESQERVATLDAENKGLTQRAKQLEHQFADACEKADNTEVQLDSLMTSVQEYKATTREKVVNIARKFDDMLNQRNSLVAQLEAERRLRQEAGAVASEIAEKDEVIERLRSECENSRRVIDALNDAQDATGTHPQGDTAEIPIDDVRQKLANAELKIKRLEADLRMRGDLISAFEEDTRELPDLEEEIESKDSRIAVLSNELSLALAEVGRLSSGAPRADDKASDALRASLDESEKLVARQAEVIAHLEEQLLETPSISELEQQRARVEELEQDLRASGTLIRQLESELADLSGAGVRASQNRRH